MHHYPGINRPGYNPVDVFQPVPAHVVYQKLFSQKTITNYNNTHTHTTINRPLWGGGEGWIQRVEFPHHRAVATRWNSCLVQVEESCGPNLWAMASPNDRMTWMVSSARTPKVSATMGMNSTPADRHPARCDVSLSWTPTCTAGRVWLGEKAASPKVCCWRERGDGGQQGNHGSRWGGRRQPVGRGNRR